MNDGWHCFQQDCKPFSVCAEEDRLPLCMERFCANAHSGEILLAGNKRASKSHCGSPEKNIVSKNNAMCHGGLILAKAKEMHEMLPR